MKKMQIEGGLAHRSHAGLHGEGGFTIVEMLLSMAIMIGITAVIFSLVDPSHGTYRTQPEVSDMQQRLRVSTSFLASDLLMAGAGAPSGGMSMGSLINYFAPIQPIRTGFVNPDIGAGVFYRDDAITVFYVPVGAPQTTLAENMPQPSSELKVEASPSCGGQSNPLSCQAGFKDGMKVIIFDDTGAWDDMTITHVQDSSLHMQHNKSVPGNELSKKYGTNAQIAQVQQRTYYLNNQTQQLMYYDGFMREEAVVDNVVDVEFEYFGEARPPTLFLDASNAQQTTYGPKPPDVASGNGTTWPAGQNCIFTRDAGGQAVPRLANLAVGSAGLVKLTQAQLSDGPWCPDGAFPTRFDADLYRVRKVGVMLRVQVASADLRGPAGALFRNGGTSTKARSLVPDQEIRFEVTPRNINLGR
jgi:type II secretory pathway pseudopilin PulG